MGNGTKRRRMSSRRRGGPEMEGRAGGCEGRGVEERKGERKRRRMSSRRNEEDEEWKEE
jgi:hypothetical protein